MTAVDTQQVHGLTTDACGPIHPRREPSGFKAYRQTGIILEVAHNVEQNVTLQIGATTPGGDLVGSKDMSGSNASGAFSVAGGQANGIN